MSNANPTGVADVWSGTSVTGIRVLIATQLSSSQNGWARTHGTSCTTNTRPARAATSRYSQLRQ